VLEQALAYVGALVIAHRPPMKPGAPGRVRAAGGPPMSGTSKRGAKALRPGLLTIGSSHVVPRALGADHYRPLTDAAP
jgi:hypothetical protein